MAADSQPHEVQPNDLFGRWLAHHEHQATDEPSDEAGPDGASADPVAQPRVSRRLPSAAIASSAVANDPVIGRRIAPPLDLGVRRAATPGGAPPSEPDREPPPGWEPIIIGSVRKKAEKSDPSRDATSPLDRPGRLARLKARLVEPAEPVEDAAPVTDPLPAAPITPPRPTAPRPPALPQRTSARSIEETIRAAVAPPKVEPVAPVRPEPERVVEPEPETIEADPEPEPVPEPPPAREAKGGARLAEPTARKGLFSWSRSARPSTGPSHKAPARPVRGGDAARDLVAAKAAARAANPAPQPERRAAVAVESEPVEVAPLAEQLEISKHDEVAEQMPGVYKFAPKRAVRRVLSLCLLAGMAASAYFVRLAVEVKETPAIGLATIVVLATGMVWAIRAGASVTTLTVRQGQLEVVQQGGKYVFDMASEYTMVEVNGQPGKRGWQVLFPRRGMAPFAVDATMVDPDDFMRVLRFFRPSLLHH